MIDTLNEQFGNQKNLYFYKNDADFIIAKVSNDSATAEIALHGAHVLSFTPTGQRAVIWLSPDAIFQEGKALRGGIPICWPWFGAHPTEKSLPSHGFARNRNWEVKSVDLSQANQTILTFELPASHAEQIWKKSVSAELTITIGSTLEVKLTSVNHSAETIEVGSALHTYFNIADIHNVKLTGLEQTRCLDTVSNQEFTTGPSALTVDAQTDLVFYETPATVTIADGDRQIIVEKENSLTTVVWNPWAELAAGMADFANEGYKHMICVEAVNSFNDLATIAPGSAHSLTQRIYVK